MSRRVSGGARMGGLTAAVALSLVMAGCGGTPTSQSSTISGGSSSSTDSSSSTLSSTTTTTSASSSSASSSTATGAGPVNGHCVGIDLAAATALLGGAPKQLSAPGARPPGDGAKITTIDGCSYTGTDPNLGYAVNRFESPAFVLKFIAAAKAAMAGQPGVVPFDAKLGDAAVAFTAPIGAKTMARLEIAKGDTTVAVLVAGTDGAKATSIALSVAKTLLAAL